MKRLAFLVHCISFAGFAQTYSPISVSGFNLDAVAETYPNSLSCTTQALDQVVAGGNSVMYDAGFASAASFGGGLPASGSIVSGTKTFQLMPYNGNNVLFAPAGTTNTLTLATPASYSNLSFLVFSTEGSSSINITLYYTDLSSTNVGNFTVQDWFNGSGAVISGIGRCKRVTSGVTNDGLPTNPRLYGIDVALNCANQLKQVSYVVISGVSSNPAGGGGYVMAVSGVSVNVVPPSIAYASLLCQGGAAATPTLTGATGGSYSAVPPGLSLNASSGAINLSSSGANTYTVTYTPSGTCALPTTCSLTVTPSPTITASSATVCAGQTATLSASGGSSYGWVGNNLSATSGQTVSANVASSSVYTVTGTSSGCSSSTTATITVNPVPSVVTNFAVICPGDAAALSATASIPGGTYSWLPNNQTTASISESPSASTNYTVVYTLNGCSSSAIAAVNLQPVPSLAVNSGSVCSGQPFMLSANASMAGGTYAWLPGGETSPSVSYAPATASTYTVQYTLNGCTTSAVAQVGIYPNPDAAVSASAPSVAPGDELSLTASGGGTYVWNNGMSGQTIAVKPIETTTYCATVTSVYGCTSVACVEVDVKAESTLYIPNVFTPNGDGVNDVFLVPGYNLSAYNLKVFNRWGQQMFETGDPQKGWDGSYNGQVVPGVYVFILTAKGNDGTDYKKCGHLTLLQ